MTKFDLAIVGGSVVDGSGSSPRQNNIGISDWRIVYLGPDVRDACRTIDASGRYVTPGFIDVHTHHDAQLTWDPWLRPHSTHGVTTYICGNCGFTLAPVTDMSLAYHLSKPRRSTGVRRQRCSRPSNRGWGSMSAS